MWDYNRDKLQGRMVTMNLSSDEEDEDENPLFNTFFNGQNTHEH